MPFWLALHLRYFLKKLPPPECFRRELTEFEKICNGEGHIGHILSLVYKKLIGTRRGTTPDFIKKWARDLEIELTEQQISKLLALTHKSSMCCNVQETGYKIITRWYRTPRILKKMFPQQSNVCWRCGEMEGTILHIFWNCSRIRGFWSRVREITQQIVEIELEDSPALFLLQLSDMPVRTYRKHLLAHLINAARACIPLLWKSTSPPTIGMWFGKINSIKYMEDLTADRIRNRRVPWRHSKSCDGQREQPIEAHRTPW